MDKVSEYIKNNWKNTIRDPKNLSGDIKIDKPFISPSIDGMFTDLYYWDSYFINLGLLKDGLIEQVENNLDNIMTFIMKHGFMPNANHILDRSQPPLFTRGVYDYYMYKKDKNIIYKYIDAMLKEYSFFQNERMNKEYGLNEFSTNATKEELKDSYKYLSLRVHEFSDDENKQLEIGYDLFSIAESGLDFNMRFKTKENKVAIHEFLQVDINAFLYDVENKISFFLKEIDRIEEANNFKTKAEKRKKLMDKYLKDPSTNIYLDYNFKTKEFSKVLSAVSLYPYCFNISSDKETALKILERLELEHGISAAEFRGDDYYYQWDYPYLWPSTVCLTYFALKNLKLDKEANRIARKYVETIKNNFDKTGKIFEKYNALDGSIAVTMEYETPEMLGWSAAVYRYLVEEEKL